MNPLPAPLSPPNAIIFLTRWYKTSVRPALERIAGIGPNYLFRCAMSCDARRSGSRQNIAWELRKCPSGNHAANKVTSPIKPATKSGVCAFFMGCNTLIQPGQISHRPDQQRSNRQRLVAPRTYFEPPENLRSHPILSKQN
jgi:hypothetical protein